MPSVLASASLLGENVDSVVVLHVKASRRVGFVDRGSVESESDLVDVKSLAVAVRVHEFFQLSILLNLELDDTSVLSAHLQVDVLGGAFGSGGLVILVVSHFPLDF